MGAPRAGAVLASALALAACGGGQLSPTMMPTPAPASTPVAASTPSLAPTTPPTAGPSPTPLAFVSAAYGYRVWLPADRRARQAQQPWDGRARIDSNGPYVDSVTLPGSIILFVYGAPTGLDLEAYATKTQAQMVAWHACPATPDSTPPSPWTAPRAAAPMTCRAVRAELMSVLRRQGPSTTCCPPGSRAGAEQLFRDLVATLRWPACGRTIPSAGARGPGDRRAQR